MTRIPPSARAIYADTIAALEPYLPDVVFIGGWVHALYLADVGSELTPVSTTDIDITVPVRLPPGNRPPFIECIRRAGFVEFDAVEGEARNFVHLSTLDADPEHRIELDLITTADDPRVPRPIEGQEGLIAHGFPTQHILQAHTTWLEIGSALHESLAPPRRIRVPTIGAYVLVKGLSSASRARTRSRKTAKDIVYLLEIMKERPLAQQAYEELPELARRYPVEYAEWRHWIDTIRQDEHFLQQVADAAESFAHRPISQSRRLVGLKETLGDVLRRTPKHRES
jgi:hypothetical protein